MVPLLKDTSRPWKTAAFSQYPRAGNVMGYSVRTERWRYTQWVARDSDEVIARKLYDHTDGSTCESNLAADGSRTQEIEELAGLIQRQIDDGRSTEGTACTNDGTPHLYPEWIRRLRSGN